MRFVHDLVYELGRKKTIGDVITNYGRIIEDKDRFICIVSQNVINRKCKTGIYKLEFRGFFYNDKETKEIFNYYSLNKPVYYVLENIVFDRSLEFFGNMGTHIIFKNCSFKDGVGIYWADNVVFENNRYYDNYPLYSFGKTFFSNRHMMVRNLKFINDNFVNSYVGYHPTKFGMDFEVSNLEIIDTNINVVNNCSDIISNYGGLNIKADKLRIVNSSIDVAEFYLDAKSIDIDENSSIKVSQGMLIENMNEDLDINNIMTSYLVYNGVEFAGNNYKEIVKDKIELQKIRTNFVRMIEGICEKGKLVNERKIDEIRDELESRSLKKVLKR